MTTIRALALGFMALALPGLNACAAPQAPKADTATAAAMETTGVAEFYAVFHEQDGRFYAFGDRKVYQDFVGGHEPAYVLTRIGGGPQKQTLTFGMTKDESKARVEDLGYMNLYAGTAEPAAGFYGEVVRDGRFFVFDDWHDMKEFMKSGEAPYIFTHIGKAPQGATLTVVRNKKTVKDNARAETLVAQFRDRHGL
jgi:hypothetical protein